MDFSGGLYSAPKSLNLQAPKPLPTAKFLKNPFSSPSTSKAATAFACPSSILPAKTPSQAQPGAPCVPGLEGGGGTPEQERYLQEPRLASACAAGGGGAPTLGPPLPHPPAPLMARHTGPPLLSPPRPRASQRPWL